LFHNPSGKLLLSKIAGLVPQHPGRSGKPSGSQQGAAAKQEKKPAGGKKKGK
jgi:hypothetical protein